MKVFNVTIGKDKNQSFINVYSGNKRYRFWSGKAINVKLKSSEDAKLLKAAFELKLREGWRPMPKKNAIRQKPITVIQALEHGVGIKVSQRCSDRFIKDAQRVVKLWKRYESDNNIKGLTLDNLHVSNIREFLVRPNWSSKTQRTVKSTLSPLLNECKPGLVNNVKLKKPISSLHKPFADVAVILEEIKEYNTQLYLCCLMTYGCLLRPHREIRELTWGDFTDDLSYIKLSGSRNKSGRNRIVPVPSYVYRQQKVGNEDASDDKLEGLYWVNDPANTKNATVNVNLFGKDKRKNGFNELRRRSEDMCKLLRSDCNHVFDDPFAVQIDFIILIDDITKYPLYD